MYRLLIKPLLFSLPAELAHSLAFWLLRVFHRLPLVARLMRAIWWVDEPALEVQVMGLRFPNPVLLAAGFDKHALGYEALSSLGFGAIEIGTVTAEAQSGNPKPRLFRLPRDRALLNRMGFNNSGARAVSGRLTRRRRTLVGVNIGKTKRVSEADAVADYVASAERLGPLADYFVVNVSSPNTPGLRDLQSTERLRPLLSAVKRTLESHSAAPKVPLLVKIAPDLSDEDVLGVADLALELGIDGIIATNTTVLRSGLSTGFDAVSALGAGGISGAPLKQRSLEVLRLLRGRAGARLTLIAAGGIESVDDAWDRLVAGASLIQIYTAFVYQGPGLPSRLAHGLLARAQAEGFEGLSDALAHHHARLSAVSLS